MGSYPAPTASVDPSGDHSRTCASLRDLDLSEDLQAVGVDHGEVLLRSSSCPDTPSRSREPSGVHAELHTRPAGPPDLLSGPGSVTRPTISCVRASMMAVPNMWVTATRVWSGLTATEEPKRARLGPADGDARDLLTSAGVQKEGGDAVRAGLPRGGRGPHRCHHHPARLDDLDPVGDPPVAGSSVRVPEPRGAREVPVDHQAVLGDRRGRRSVRRGFHRVHVARVAHQ